MTRPIVDYALLDVAEQQRLSEIEHRERTQNTSGPTHDDFAFLLGVINTLEQRLIDAFARANARDY